MESVSYELFNKFIEENKLIKKHSKYWDTINYVDNQGVVKAVYESSSWSGDVFLIDIKVSDNLRTLNYVRNLLLL